MKSQMKRGLTCQVPRPKVVTGMSSSNHLKRDSSPLAPLAAVELDSRPKGRNLPGRTRRARQEVKTAGWTMGVIKR